MKTFKHKSLRLVLMILVMIMSLYCFVNAEDYYVDTGGSNTTGNGSQGNPWQTIEYALTQVSYGDLIKINDGVYSEEQLNVPEGASLTSTSQDNAKVTIQPANSAGIGSPFINIVSDTPGSSGNQHISYVAIDGDAIGGGKRARGILIQNRNDVRIHHCAIRDFGGVQYGGGVFVKSTSIPMTTNWWDIIPHDTGPPGDDSSFETTSVPWPSVSVEHFEFDHNTVVNCGFGWDNWTDPRGYGQLNLWSVKDSQIHHNLLDNSAMADHCIRGFGSCTALLWNVDFYNNEMHMKQRTNAQNFGFEVWLLRGGCEIYNNTFDNIALSITQGKETEVCNNIIIHSPYLSGANSALGIEFTYQSYGKINGNYIEGSHPTAISVGTADCINFWKALKDVVISNNICVGAYTFGIGLTVFKAQTIADGFKIYNNVVARGNDSSRLIYTGLKLDVFEGATLKNTEVANNIVIGAGTYGGRTLIEDGSTYSNNTITNNLFYECDYNDWLHDTDINTIIADPEFVDPANGDYHLQEGSPAIDAGIDVGLPFNGSAPDMGAYEYGGTGISKEKSLMPNSLNLSVNSLSDKSVVFNFIMENPDNYSLNVYNIAGKKVWCHNVNKAKAGKHRVNWHLNTMGNRKVRNGIYFAVLKTGNHKISKYFVVLH